MLSLKKVPNVRVMRLKIRVMRLKSSYLKPFVELTYVKRNKLKGR